MCAEPRTAAVVVAHDSAADLPACLEALLAQEPRPLVVVVDNASGDGSAALVRERFPAVRLLALEENTGFAGGCNRGFAAVAGETDLVAFANPDLVVRPGCLAACAEALAQDAGLAGVAPLLLRPDGATVDSVGQVLDPVRLEVRDRGYGQALRPELERRREVLAACGALAVYRTAALEQVAQEGGPWAEPFFCFWEDLELGWRLVNAGWRVEALPQAVAEHGRGAGAAAGRGPLRWRRPVALEACILTNRWMTLLRHLHHTDLAMRAPLLLPWEAFAVTTGLLRRPALLGHLRRRWPLVAAEWRRRGERQRRRLRDLPW